ncbi:hypothetical protein ACT3TH_10360 [Psychrobacter sp. AOP22-C1-C5]|uniref:hypothetical protein n=1 Tax=Psychrobacter sp. AOP22-C1-C5 TaxID=3457716 RepID=UPI004035EFF1
MKSFVLEGNRRSVEVTVQVEDYIKVHSYDASKEVHFHYFLARCDYENLAAFTSIDDLLKFAKANHIFRDYPKAFCPCPPETSPLDEVGGGILARHALLKESVPVCECGSTFYRDDLGSCYDCFFPSDDRGE